ncbi:MAG: hypothetical protein E3J37_10820 [Anaerolineales bacterium]|nr:MAG: hypothetical protein E3J37_10820 [Anaerolineales bacterium]
MKGKVSKALLLVLVLSLAVVGVAYAEEDVTGDRIRVVGEITGVDLVASTFSLHAWSGMDLRFFATHSTRFRSSDGSVHELSDLEVGMRALVIGVERDGGLVALMVVTAKLDNVSDRVRVFGEITGAVSVGGSFSLEKRGGEVVTIQTNERTRFRSRDGLIQGLDDLEAGMVALAIAVEQEDGELLALVIAAGYKEDLPDNLRKFQGEIIGVVPGQGIFTLTTREGEAITFQTSDRTRFRSRDGSVTDINDLKKGMIALVGALQTEEGTLLAGFVTAWNPANHPGVDVRASGRIVSLGDRSFTIETRGGDRMTFSVDGSTKFRSRDGSVKGFDDLQVWMIAIVGANELGNGDLKAVWVGAGKPAGERPTLDSNRLEEHPPLREVEPIT